MTTFNLLIVGLFLPSTIAHVQPGTTPTLFFLVVVVLAQTCTEVGCMSQLYTRTVTRRPSPLLSPSLQIPLYSSTLQSPTLASACVPWSVAKQYDASATLGARHRQQHASCGAKLPPLHNNKQQATARAGSVMRRDCPCCNQVPKTET